MIVSERDLCVVFQPSVDSLSGLIAPHSKDKPLSLQGPWRPRQSILRAWATLSVHSRAELGSLAVAQPMTMGILLKAALPGNKYFFFSYFQIY
jgi:hypothetical protein